VIFGRRVRFALVVIGSHILLIALAVAWLIQMIVIARNGSVKFVEYNQTILIVEIVFIALISIFGISILFMQIKRLGEKRSVDRKEGNLNRK
jgi:hypothetical protein